MALSKLERRNRIHLRIRKTINGTAATPRLSVFRSNKEIYAQLIDDINGITLVSASSREEEIKVSGKIESAQQVGKLFWQNEPLKWESKRFVLIEAVTSITVGSKRLPMVHAKVD